jgi:hypothetical protein
MIKKGGICWNCCWWDCDVLEREIAVEDKTEELADGHCRRHSPTIRTGLKGVFITDFPRTSGGDWCGDWENTRLPDLPQ